MINIDKHRKTLFTDGEGPITPKDLARDIFAKIIFNYDGIQVPGEVYYSVLSFYDDYLSEKGTQGYQAGDTLALIAPHLVAHNITHEDVVSEAQTATLCPSIEEHIKGLQRDGWNIRIISTAYSQVWELIGKHLGIPMEHIACTELNLDFLHGWFGNETFKNTVKFAEQKVLALLPLAQQAMKEVDSGKPIVEILEKEAQYALLLKALDGLYWIYLPEFEYETLEQVKVMGGKRKVEAAKKFANELGIPLSETVYVGDSITDSEVARAIGAQGGLTIAQNGNSYILRDSRVGVATKDMRKTRPVLDAWSRDGFSGVIGFVQQTKGGLLRSKEGQPLPENVWGAKYDIVDLSRVDDFARILKNHKECRSAIRGLSTARLG